MKFTQATSLQLGSVTISGKSQKASIGGGTITTPAVAAHVRRKMEDASSVATSGKFHLGSASRNCPLERKASIGGGTIITPAVAAHMRRKMADTDQRSV